MGLVTYGGNIYLDNVSLSGAGTPSVMDQGSAIYLSGGSLYTKGGSISDNESKGKNAAGIYASGAQVSIDGTNFANNRAPEALASDGVGTTGGHGGAIFATNSKLRYGIECGLFG